MANDKNFVVKNGLTSQNISFVDDISSPSVTIEASVTGNTLSFSGTAGQLFSITDSGSGTIFSVNDISGIPSIEVDDDGTIRLAEFAGNVLIGTATDNGTDALQVDGSVSATTFTGALSGNANTASAWQTARTITLGGVLSGSVSLDGSSNVTLTAAHTSDPVITLTGAVTGSGTMTNLGSVSIATTATADPTLTLAGDATGSATFTNLGNATLTVTVVDDSHEHKRLASQSDPSVAPDGALEYINISGSTTDAPTTDWWNIIRMGHGDPNTYYNNTLAMKMTGTGAGGLWGRTRTNGTAGSWFRYFDDNYHPNADKWTTARTITLGGVLSGSVSIDGSSNVTLTAAHTSDPVITLTGAVTGSGTMTNLGSVSIATTATADPTLTLAGDATGSATFTNLGNATLTVAIVDDSHDHTGMLPRAEIPGSTDLNSYRTTGYYIQDSNADAGSGSNYPVALAGILEVYNGDIGNGLQTHQEYYVYNDHRTYRRHYYNGTWGSWSLIWNSNTDGASSGLDADLLDGQHGSYYLDWTNTSNKPDPVITLTGAVTGSGTMTDLGSVSIATTATADPTLTLAGDATGSATFTNLGNATLTVTVVDDSHNHIISNVDGLQTALDIKWPIEGSAPSDLDSAGQGLWRINTGHTNQPAGTNYGTLLSFDNTADTGFQLASDYQGSAFYWRAGNASVYGGSGSFSAWRKIWHDGNDGAGSGLDADTVDTLHASSFFRSDTSNSVDVRLASGDGRGMRFWDSDNYKIWMSSASNATYGGRISGETTSDYNMYFRMAAGTNRGFVFESAYATKLLSINPTGVNTGLTINAATFNATSTTNGGFQGIDADSATTPSFTWTSDQNTGMYRVGADSIGFTAGGANRLTVNTSLMTSTTTINAPTFNATSTTNGGFQGIDADSATLPSFTWTSDQNTGMYQPAADTIGFTTAGTNRVSISNSGISTSYTITAPTFNATTLAGGAFQGVDSDSYLEPGFTWTSDQNTGMWHRAADQIGFSAGGNDEFWITTTYTESAGSSRAPIFYDSQNTAYYIDPTGTSRLNAVYGNGYYNGGVSYSLGPILTYTLTSAGSGYTDGTYTNQVLSGSSIGKYATVDIVVAGGVITSATITERGSAWAVNETITIPALGGTGSGGLITVNSVRSVDMSLYSGAARIRLGCSDTTLVSGQEIGGIYFNSRDASAGGSGDKAYILGTAEGTAGGGKIEFWTSSNGGQPTLCAAVGGANDFRLYNTAGTFYHAFSNAPTSNKTLTLPDVTGTVLVTSGTTNTAGYFNTGTTTPSGSTRLNYAGYFYPTYINLVGSADTTTAATHYFVETGSDGYVRPKTLANVKTEIVTTAAVNAAAATTVGTITSGTWNAGAVTTTTISSGSNATAGTVTGDWTLTTGSTWQATYADLAEYYVADKRLPYGTVVRVAYDEEHDIEAADSNDIAIGVISTNPAFIMNAADRENGQAVGLKGRVPVRVIGPIQKGRPVYVADGGVASAVKTDSMVGVALETNLNEAEKLVECVLKV